MANSEFNIQDYWDSYNLDDVSAEDEAAILAAIIEGFETTSLQPATGPSSSQEQNSIVLAPDAETAILAEDEAAEDEAAIIAAIIKGFETTSLQPATGQEKNSIVLTPDAETAILAEDEAAIIAAIIEGFETTSLQPATGPSSSQEKNSIVLTPDAETAILAAIIEAFETTSLQPDSGPSSSQERNSIVQTPESSILHVDATIHATIDIPLGRQADRPETRAQEPAPPVPDEAYCSICMETKPLPEFFNTKFCTHLYCNECVGSYVTGKIQDGVGWINCPEPGCEAGFLDPDTCHLMLPQSLIDRWGDLVCEAMIQVKFYCPYKDCSALLINDQEDGDGEEIIVQSECPHCYRLFCAQCRSLWHQGLKCEEVQKLGEGDREREDLMLKKVAESSQWQRCPECQFFVERDEGCNHITCRCKYEFCYRCGAKWKSSHYGCTGAK